MNKDQYWEAQWLIGELEEAWREHLRLWPDGRETWGAFEGCHDLLLSLHNIKGEVQQIVNAIL